MFDSVYDKKRVFLTGHTGFKGSWLSMWLLKLGAQVIGFSKGRIYDNSLYDLLGLEKHVRTIQGDIRDLDALSRAVRETKPHMVFHLGAQALVREAYRDPKTTFDVNVGGSVNVLEAVRASDTATVLVYISSDKCYRNREWEWGYRENDILGGEDPYGASKGCAEIVFSSYQHSYLLRQGDLKAASARSGNVIGGGDWAPDRIVPDCIRALRENRPIVVRSPRATRPWQHVLEPLGGYLLLGARLFHDEEKTLCSGWNFGPDRTSNKSVKELVDEIIRVWDSGELVVEQDPNAPHENILLQLNCDKAYHRLGWKPTWHFRDSVEQTTLWYKAYTENQNIWDFTESQITQYMKQWE